MIRLALLPLAACLLAPSAPALPQCEVLWDASTSLEPDEMVPAWTEFDTSLNGPQLGPTSLTIDTATNAETLYYVHDASQLALPPVLVMETAVWVVSGSTTFSAREATSIGFELQSSGNAHSGQTVFIGRDEVFVLQTGSGSACNAKGTSVSVPTMDGFHTYRIELDFTTVQITVYQDDLPILSGVKLYAYKTTCGKTGTHIVWGDATGVASGVTEWAYFRHNAGMVGTTTAYCTSGTSASGCQAALAYCGTPSATATSGFRLLASGVEGGKDGLYFFGTNGRQANSWGNGTSYQCVVPPVKRGGLLSGKGSPNTCSGSFFQDLNALWSGAPAKNPGAGAVVQAQLWYRDPQNTSNQTTSLSNAVEFTLQP